MTTSATAAISLMPVLTATSGLKHCKDGVLACTRACSPASNTNIKTFAAYGICTEGCDQLLVTCALKHNVTSNDGGRSYQRFVPGAELDTETLTGIVTLYEKCVEACVSTESNFETFEACVDEGCDEDALELFFEPVEVVEVEFKETDPDVWLEPVDAAPLVNTFDSEHRARVLASRARRGHGAPQTSLAPQRSSAGANAAADESVPSIASLSSIQQQERDIVVVKYNRMFCKKEPPGVPRSKWVCAPSRDGLGDRLKALSAANHMGRRANRRLRMAQMIGADRVAAATAESIAGRVTIARPSPTPSDPTPPSAPPAARSPPGILVGCTLGKCKFRADPPRTRDRDGT